MDELISKQAAIEAINLWLYCDKDERMPADVIKALPPVYVPEMNVGDMISRQAAMERLMAQNVIMDGSEYHNGFNAGVNRAQTVIRNLPSAQPEQRYTVRELSVFRHGISLSLCSKKSAQRWRYDEDTAIEIEFLEHLFEKVGEDIRGCKDADD